MRNSELIRLIPILPEQGQLSECYQQSVSQQCELKCLEEQVLKYFENFLRSCYFFVFGLTAFLIGGIMTVKLDAAWPFAIGFVFSSLCVVPIVISSLSVRSAENKIRLLGASKNERSRVLHSQPMKLMWCLYQRAESHNELAHQLSLVDVVGMPLSNKEVRYLQLFRTEVMDELVEMDELLAVLNDQDHDHLAKTPAQTRMLGYLTMSTEEFLREHLASHPSSG
jgi:hypothetical protein